MREQRVAGIVVVGLCLIGARTAGAQVTVTLPDTSQTTTLTATVSAQARVSVPAGVTFDVLDIALATTANPASITITNLVTPTAASQLRISLQADTANFTPPSAGTTWNASDVTWAAATWTNATGAVGTLSSSAFNVVANCNANASACNTSGLVFALAAKTSVNRSGNHTIVVRWRFQAIRVQPATTRGPPTSG